MYLKNRNQHNLPTDHEELAYRYKSNLSSSTNFCLRFLCIPCTLYNKTCKFTSVFQILFSANALFQNNCPNLVQLCNLRIVLERIRMFITAKIFQISADIVECFIVFFNQHLVQLNCCSSGNI